MPMAESTKSGRKRKSQKPYPGFPLTAHPSGRWCKKHRGKQYYFGRIDNWQDAIKRYEWKWPHIIDGRTPPPVDTGDGCTVRLLYNAFLNTKLNRLNSGELSQRTFSDYYAVCDLLVSHFGRDRRVDDLRPDDFESFRNKLAKRGGVVTLRNIINRCRVVLKYAYDQRLIEQPVNYGQSFGRPSAKALRKARNDAGPRLFGADEICRILNALDGKPVQTGDVADDGEPEIATINGDPALKAMVLLGVNCGFGNSDVASLPQTAIDLEAGWIDFPRPKTEVPRRVPLWQETIDTLREAIATRPAAKDSADDKLCFLTARGNRWVRVQLKRPGPNDGGSARDKAVPKFTTLDALSQRFAKILKILRVNGRKGLGFYTLRHCFETQAGESRDQVAVNAIMGHVDNSMAGVYRERISDERLRAVVETVRKWLWPAKS